MSANVESYRQKTFVVTDADARIRIDDNLLAYARYAPGDPLPPGAAAGDFKRIPAGTRVRVAEVRLVPTGSSSVTIFAHALPETGGMPFGWTSARNFAGRFIGETLGTIAPEPGAGRYGPNAAWSRGEYVGQVTLVRIVSNNAGDPVRYIAESTSDAFLGMVAAAAGDGVDVALTSGFRTYGEQKYLHDGYVAGRPGFNKAAKPGNSRHQNGIAFDIAVSGGDGSPTYEWLKDNATAHGFLRTVSGEPWHWEYDPTAAEKARNAGRYALPGIA